MVAEKYRSFLENLEYTDSFHSFRKFSTHLIGTCNVLEEWGRAEYLCAAGLFHSIYGTVAFKKQSLSIKDREKIQNLIGLKSEELVYLFCMTNRQFLKQCGNKNKYLEMRTSKDIIFVSDTVFRDLMEIEAANLIEQAPYLILHRRRTKRYAQKLLTDGEEYLSNEAITALSNFTKKKELFFIKNLL